MRTLYKCGKIIAVNGIHLKGDYLTIKKSSHPDADLEAIPFHKLTSHMRDVNRIESIRPNGDMTVSTESSILPDFWKRIKVVNDD